MNTKLGRFHVAEPPSTLRTMHRHGGQILKPVDHEPPLAVLDQEDLLAQGIRTSLVVPGAKDVDALGSCVFNAATAHLSGLLPSEWFADLIGVDDSPYSATVQAEEFAISLYHKTTDLTGDPSTEWPPTDCGSSGLYVCKELHDAGIIEGFRTAASPLDVPSLLQARTVIVGSPWFNSWFDPDADGFVDGDGTVEDLDRAVESGVAGGHETCIAALEHVVQTASGTVDPGKTVLRVRNSWGASWGDHGEYRVHLSTWAMLAHYVDFRQAELAL